MLDENLYQFSKSELYLKNRVDVLNIVMKIIIILR